jgi:VanZ family protein
MNEPVDAPAQPARRPPSDGHGRARGPRWLRAWAPALAYMLLIWALSSIPKQFDFSRVPFRDKGVHFVEYGALAMLLAHAALGTWRQMRSAGLFALAAAVTTLWGIIDEIHQAFVPGRVSDAQDVMADALGALAGATLYLLLRAWRARSS